MAKLNPPVNDNDHIRGNSQGIISLVEYGDYQCPHCAASHPVVKGIRETLGKKLRFVFRHFPITNIHPMAFPAALAAEAAGVQGRFWEMHDMIFERQPMLSEYTLIEFAQELHLDLKEFKKDLLSHALQEKIEKDFESGMRSGVNGTPTFFINGYKHNGSFEYQTLLAAIEEQSQPVF